MGDEGQGVHLIAVEQHIHLHQLGGLVLVQLVVQRGVALGAGLEGVEKVVDDLAQGHGVVQLHQVGVQILHVLELAPALLAHGHDVAHIVGRRDDGHLGVGLLSQLDHRRVRVIVGIVHHDHGAVGLGDTVDHRGQGGDEIQIELPLQPLLDDLHVEHAQKAAAEAEAQGGGGLGLEGQGGVVELELLQGVPQIWILGAVLGVNAAVHHGAGGAVAGQGLGGGALHTGDGVTHLGILHVFDGGSEVAHLAGDQLAAGLHPQGEQVAALQHLIGRARGHHLHLHPGLDGTLHHTEIDDHAPVGVVLAVKDQGAERGLRVALGGGDILYDVLQYRVDVQPHLGGDLGGVLGGQADDVLNLVLHPLGVGGRQVDLVDDGQNLQVVLQGQEGVGQGLGLDALGGVHDEHRALAGGQGAAHLIVEVHVARRVDQVQLIGLPVGSLIVELHRPGLDGNAPLPLQVHVVQQLALHLPLGNGVALLNQPVRQGGFAVVDVGDNGKVADFGLVSHGILLPSANPPGTPRSGARRPAASKRFVPRTKPCRRRNLLPPRMQNNTGYPRSRPTPRDLICRGQCGQLSKNYGFCSGRSKKYTSEDVKASIDIGAILCISLLRPPRPFKGMVPVAPPGRTR